MYIYQPFASQVSSSTMAQIKRGFIHDSFLYKEKNDRSHHYIHFTNWYWNTNCLCTFQYSCILSKGDDRTKLQFRQKEKEEALTTKAPLVHRHYMKHFSAVYQKGCSSCSAEHSKLVRVTPNEYAWLLLTQSKIPWMNGRCIQVRIVFQDNSYWILFLCSTNPKSKCIFEVWDATNSICIWEILFLSKEGNITKIQVLLFFLNRGKKKSQRVQLL